MRETPSSLAVREAVVRADVARRTAAFWRAAGRWSPLVALAAALITAGAAVLGGPMWAGVSVLGAGVSLALVGWARARRSQPVSGEAARSIDRQADLCGALQSACWFASAADDRSGQYDESWVTFHLASAAERVAGVDWTAVYPRPQLARPVALAALLVACTAGFSLWPSPPRPLSTSASGPGASGDEAGLADALPASLVPQVVEGVKAIRAGRAPSAEALAAIGQILEIADRDASAQKQLDDLLKDAASWDPGYIPTFEAMYDPSQGRGEEDDWQGGEMTSTGLEWAYQEALAQAVEARERAKDQPPAVAIDAANDGEPSEGEAESGSEDSQSGSAMLADTRGEASSFSSLLFGRQQANDGAGRSGTPAQRKALSAALRNEVVNAKADIAVAGMERSATRRTTTVNRSTDVALGSTGGMTYDRGRSAEPPPVPEARRAVVHDYFVRAAEPPAPAKQP